MNNPRPPTANLGDACHQASQDPYSRPYKHVTDTPIATHRPLDLDLYLTDPYLVYGSTHGPKEENQHQELKYLEWLG